LFGVFVLDVTGKITRRGPDVAYRLETAQL